MYGAPRAKPVVFCVGGQMIKLRNYRNGEYVISANQMPIIEFGNKL
jgi:hypothetical protein